jgi:hypothetical protein
MCLLAAQVVSSPRKAHFIIYVVYCLLLFIACKLDITYNSIVILCSTDCLAVVSVSSWCLLIVMLTVHPVLCLRRTIRG